MNGDETEAEFIEYYKNVRDNLDKAMRIIKWNCDNSNCEINAEDIKMATEITGVVFILADKNYGITLLPIDSMVEAEKNMLAELKAQSLNSTSSEVIQIVLNIRCMRSF